MFKLMGRPNGIVMVLNVHMIKFVKPTQLIRVTLDRVVWLPSSVWLVYLYF